jgi:hypothetical protein
MSVYSATRRTQFASSPLLPYILAALGAGVALFSVFVLLAVVFFDINYAGKVYPGV